MKWLTRDDVALEVEFTLENVAEGVLIFAGLGPVDRVVRAHNRSNSGPDRLLKPRQIDLTPSPIVDLVGLELPRVLLVVERVVLRLRRHILRLDPLGRLRPELAHQVGVRAEALEGASCLGGAGDVEHGAGEGVAAGEVGLLAEEGGAVVDELAVEGSRGVEGGGGGRVAGVAAVAVGAVAPDRALRGGYESVWMRDE